MILVISASRNPQYPSLPNRVVLTSQVAKDQMKYDGWLIECPDISCFGLGFWIPATRCRGEGAHHVYIIKNDLELFLLPFSPE